MQTFANVYKKYQNINYLQKLLKCEGVRLGLRYLGSVDQKGWSARVGSEGAKVLIMIRQ